MVGLDTSHAVEFTRRLQAPGCPADLRVAGARVVSCVRFVHGVEMLQRALGRGARTVSAHPVSGGAVLVVEYEHGATGVVELYEGGGYGGVLRAAPGGDGPAPPYVVDMRTGYSDLLRAVVPFLAGAPTPVPLADTLEVMAILDAADRASRSGRPESTLG